MKDDGLIVAAWAEAVRNGTSAVLATVVKVEGSAYRSPGARMLITENGARTGSVSGGCLEGDILKKAWWLTDAGKATVRVYDSTSDDEAIWAFGLGCNGAVHVLLERWEGSSATPVAELLSACRTERRAGAMATIISGPLTGRRTLIFPDGRRQTDIENADIRAWVEHNAARVLESRKSGIETMGGVEAFIEYVAAPVPLLIIGAGQDALPVVRFAKELGWHVTVVDGRANQARPDRFPLADRVIECDLNDPLRGLTVDEQTVAVIMSHSYPQDRTFLHNLYSRPLRYLGVLGPRRRTERMLDEIGVPPQGELHSPIGLDIGADTPEEIALAIIAEIQAELARRPAGMLHRKPGPIHEERRKPAAVPA